MGYFSAADPSMPMQMVKAEDQANAQPMPPELIPQFMPGGVPMGFVPMLVGGAPAMTGTPAPAVQDNFQKVPEAPAPPTAVEPSEADKKKKSSSGEKKVSSKKKVKSS